MIYVPQLRRRLLRRLGISHFFGFSGSSSFETGFGAALASIGLLLQLLFLRLDGFHVVDGFDQDTLVLELVSFGQHVEGVVDVLVDFLSVPHLLQQAP